MLFSEVTSAISFERRNLGKELVDARNNLIDMHLLQSLKNEYCFDLPLFSKYPTTSIKSYFYKMTNFIFRTPGLYCIWYTVFYENTSALGPINSFKLLLRGMGAENLCDSLIIHKSDQVDP